MCASFGRLRRSKEIPGMESRKLTCSLAAVSHPINEGLPGLLGEWLLPLPLWLLDAGPARLSFWFCSARLLTCCLLAPLQTSQPSSRTFSSARFPSGFQAHNDGAGGSMPRAQVSGQFALRRWQRACPPAPIVARTHSWEVDMGMSTLCMRMITTAPRMWRWEGAGPRKVWFLTHMYTYMHLYTSTHVCVCVHTDNTHTYTQMCSFFKKIIKFSL